ncbi:MAG: ArsR family transcriptional regulator [Methanospirillum sp.]|nr:ArsR family transcriptional regulator [Methanospirillum sp.]
MRVVIVFYSLSGNTRRVAKLLASRLAGPDLVEVHDRHQYSTLTAYASGAPRAMRGEVAEVDPSEIEVGDYDLVVLGSPVWAFSPTPAVNGIVAALRGIEGKEVVIFVTSAGVPGDAAGKLQAASEARGARVRGSVAFDRKDLDNERKMADLVGLVTRPPSAG